MICDLVDFAELENERFQVGPELFKISELVEEINLIFHD